MATIAQASGIRPFDVHHSSTLRINWRRFSSGNDRISCPPWGRAERDKTVGLAINSNGSGVTRCFRCNYNETYRVGNPNQYRLRHGINTNVDAGNIVTLSVLPAIQILMIRESNDPVRFEEASHECATLRYAARKTFYIVMFRKGSDLNDLGWEVS